MNSPVAHRDDINCHAGHDAGCVTDFVTYAAGGSVPDDSGATSSVYGAKSGGHSEAHHPVGPETLLWPWVNFILFLLILAYAYKKIGKPKLREQAAGVRSQLEESAAALAAAEEQNKKVKQSLANVEQDQKKLVEQLNREGQLSASKLVEGARSYAAHAQSDTQRRIAGEYARTRKELGAELAGKAATVAKERLSSQVSPADDAELRKQVVERV